MPFYRSDFYPLLMRAIEALDQRKPLTFAELRGRITRGEFRELIDAAGHFPMPEIPDNDWQEITDAVDSVLSSRINDESETFYVTSNGYCLLLAVLLDVERRSDGVERGHPG